MRDEDCSSYYVSLSAAKVISLSAAMLALRFDDILLFHYGIYMCSRMHACQQRRLLSFDANRL